VTVIASPRHVSSRCTDLIKSFEACEKAIGDGRFQAYPDPGTGGDPWTIGWGSTGPDIHKGLVWTQQQCDDRFAADVSCFALEVDKLIGPVSTTQSEFDAMVSLAYNIGLGNCVSLLTIQLKSLSTNSHILFAVVALCLLTLIVIVIAGGEVKFSASKTGVSGAIGRDVDDAVPVEVVNQPANPVPTTEAKARAPDNPDARP
jgi:lysozyme